MDVAVEWQPDTDPIVAPRPGSGMITIDAGEVARIVATYPPRVAAAVARAVQAEVVPMAQAAFDAWPVRSGYSRANLEVQVQPAQNTLRVSIVSGAEYSTAIYEGELVERLLVAPSRDVLARIQRALALELLGGI